MLLREGSYNLSESINTFKRGLNMAFINKTLNSFFTPCNFRKIFRANLKLYRVLQICPEKVCMS